MTDPTPQPADPTPQPADPADPADPAPPSSPPPPNERVAAAFGLEGTPERLPGGRGTSWRVGHGVLKPRDVSLLEVAWQAKVLGAIWPDGIRVAYPLRATDGKYSVEGWMASSWLDGAPAPRWVEIVEAGDRFHAYLADVRRPAFLDRRTDPWAVADRVAWEESPIEPFDDAPVVRELAGLRRPIADARSQLIHGDLTGNVLFSATEPPAIIDFAPYWRPTAFASAIVVVDAIAWEGAEPSAVELMGSIDRPEQFLIRAALFRMISDMLRDPLAVPGDPDGGAYASVVRAIRGLLR